VSPLWPKAAKPEMATLANLSSDDHAG